MEIKSQIRILNFVIIIILLLVIVDQNQAFSKGGSASKIEPQKTQKLSEDLKNDGYDNTVSGSLDGASYDKPYLTTKAGADGKTTRINLEMLKNNGYTAKVTGSKVDIFDKSGNQISFQGA